MQLPISHLSLKEVDETSSIESNNSSNIFVRQEYVNSKPLKRGPVEAHY